jgi:LysM repeat protein
MVAKTARFLAPIALAAVGVGIYLIVHSTLVKHDTTTITQSSTTLQPTRHSTHPRPKPKFYFVKQGDTLSSISARTHVGIGRIESLNPSVSAPFNLQTGQRLRLRR